jgi:hypothetical protein
MDSEPKKQQFDEEAMWLEIEKAEQEEMDEDEQAEQEMRKVEEEEMNPSAQDDDIDRLEWEHDMREMELKELGLLDIVQSMWASDESNESESEEDRDEDEEEDEDDLMVIKEIRKPMGGKV